MVHLVTILSLLFSFSAWAVAPSGAPVITLGGVYINNTTQNGGIGGGIVVPSNDITWFTVYAGTLSNGGTNVYYPFRKHGVLWQVTTGTKAYCKSITVRVSSATGGYQLVSATATFADATAAGTLTGAVHQCGSSAAGCRSGHITANTEVTKQEVYVFDGSAATVWPGAQFFDASQVYQISLTCFVI